MDYLEKALPFLDQYPAWVRWYVSVWIVLGALLLVLILLVPRTTSPPPITQSNETASPQISPPASISSTASAKGGESLNVVSNAEQPVSSISNPPAKILSLGPSDVLRRIFDKTQTKLQVMRYIDSIDGSIVTWSIAVASVSTMGRLNDSNDILMLSQPVEIEDQRHYITFTFPTSEADTLSSINVGDTVTITGTLGVRSVGLRENQLDVRDARILTIRHK